MFHDVCEFGINSFIKSTPDAPFLVYKVAYGTRGAKGEICFPSKSDISIIIFLSSIVQNEFTERAEYLDAARTDKII